ncbi:MAG: hypothetical protein E6Q97_17940 [Desulfurellales bacterium]|nr:MAG: hypothetical protein E6Q97_17940 [Desulfurellales bacterium]
MIKDLAHVAKFTFQSGLAFAQTIVILVLIPVFLILACLEFIFIQLPRAWWSARANQRKGDSE